MKRSSCTISFYNCFYLYPGPEDSSWILMLSLSTALSVLGAVASPAALTGVSLGGGAVGLTNLADSGLGCVTIFGEDVIAVGLDDVPVLGTLLLRNESINFE
jgi:hypothetical protein